MLVMDGRVDNLEDLRRELHARGAVLRDASDAELVLRAYEAWGEECPRHIIGEFVFFVWDARERRLFAARDAAGTRHFYYHAANGWFGFASEIAGLLAPGRIEPRLNESRLLDYLVEEFDRDDEVGTFYQDIRRMPAGHAMRVTERGAQTWRYWDPGNLSALHFSSLDECAEAFLDQLRVAVKCRLRSNGPVGAMLSGGLDSSSIVGLISKEFRGELRQPLQTYSLVLEERAKCLDWPSIREMLKDALARSHDHHFGCSRRCLPPLRGWNSISQRAVRTLPWLRRRPRLSAARDKGCRVVMDGMASDLFYYGSARSLGIILREGRFARIPATLAAWHRHGVEGELRGLAWTTLHWITPEALRAHYRKLREKYGLLGRDLKLLRPQTARQFLAARRLDRGRTANGPVPEMISSSHAQNFTSGMLSFAHEVHGQIALVHGRRAAQPVFGSQAHRVRIRMPLEAKLYGPWYKTPVARRHAREYFPSACVGAEGSKVILDGTSTNGSSLNWRKIPVRYGIRSMSTKRFPAGSILQVWSARGESTSVAPTMPPASTCFAPRSRPAG